MSKKFMLKLKVEAPSFRQLLSALIDNISTADTDAERLIEKTGGCGWTTKYGDNCESRLDIDAVPYEYGNKEM